MFNQTLFADKVGMHDIIGMISVSADNSLKSQLSVSADIKIFANVPALHTGHPANLWLN